MYFIQKNFILYQITIKNHEQQPFRSKFVQNKKKRNPLKEFKRNLYDVMVIVLSRPYARGLHAPIFISGYSFLIISNKCVLMQETHIMPIITGSYSHTVTARAKQENHLALCDDVNRISLPR